MFKDFKSFIMRGNTVDLAVAVIIGAAFGAIVVALVKDVITPLIAAIGGKPDFSQLSFTIHNSHILYGDFLNAVISFLIIASVVFFLIIVPINKMIALANRNKEAADENSKKCPECLSDVPKAASRCAFCTSKLK